MQILIADDDDSTRRTLKRILATQFDLSVVEASDGLEVLEKLAALPYAFAILDISMPRLSGIEVLQAIRGSRQLHDLPVLIISGKNDEGTVRQLIQLGISDFLTKPLRSERVCARVGRLLEQARRLARDHDSGGLVLRADGSTAIFVVDADAEFRHFLANVLGPKAIVRQASRASEALGLCLADPPAMVFVGTETGLMPPQMFARKLRENAPTSSVRTVAVVDAGAVGRVRGSGLFDAVVTRTFVPETFERELRGICEQPTPLTALTDIYPTFRTNLISATEQALGMMANTELSVDDGVCEMEAAEAGARVTMVLAAPELSVDLTMTCSAAAASLIAARLLASTPAEVTADDRGAALAELLNVIAGRLQKGFADHGTQARCSLPAAVSAGSSVPPSDLALMFRSDLAELRVLVSACVGTPSGEESGWAGNGGGGADPALAMAEERLR